MTSHILRVFAALFILASAMAAPPAGGGFLNAGLRGAYYNSDGSLAFERKDPRIDFQWGTAIAPGGSRGRGFNSIGTDGYRVVWTARLRARFSETYTFTVIADDAVRLRLRPVAPDSQFTDLMNSLDHTGLATHTAPFALNNSTEYELELEYRELAGDAQVRLFWESPSVPREIIDPIFEASLNWVTYEEVTFADAIMNGRGNWEQTTLDQNGWPIGDGDFIVSEINAPHAPSPMEVGPMQLSFNGRADVSVLGNGFLQPGSYLYDPVSNVSTATIVGQDFGANVLALRFRNTLRMPPFQQSGVANVKLTRPSTLPGDLLHPAARAAFGDRLTALRFQRVNDQSREWSERTPPWWPYQGAGIARPFVYNSRYGANYEGRARSAHEIEIMLCNETGNDYYVTVPHLANDAYIQNLARLIRYGSDQQGNPYSEPTASPYYPPLNPNLRVYVEISNELWNFLDRGTYSPYHDYRELIEDMADANTPDFQILNFDNLPLTLQPDGYYANNYTWVRRYWGLRTKQISDIFRATFGDDAMPASSSQPRIRPYLGYQYANANQTAEMPLQFLDNYYNNGAGNFVPVARPVSYYLFAAGGAGYYGSANPTGRTDGLIPNNSFETDGSWTFTGSAGVIENVSRSPMIVSQDIGALRNDLTGWYGMRFATGAERIWVYELGRYVHAPLTRAHAMVLVRDDNGQVITYSEPISTGEVGSFSYSRCVPVLLEANTIYSILSEEFSGYDPFAMATAVMPLPGMHISGAVQATRSPENTYITLSVGDWYSGFGPLNLRVAPATARGNPDAYHGSRVAYISNENNQPGALEITISVPENSPPRTYGLNFRAVQRSQRLSSQPDAMNLRITANGVDISYRGINGQPQPYSPFFPWRRISYWIGEYFFTETFTISPQYPVTLRIEGIPQGAGSHMAFLDDLQIGSVDAIFEAGIPDTGEATGQPGGGDYTQGLRMDARWAHSFGLHHMTYEHGWSIGGDSGASPVQEHAKYRDPRAAQTMIDAVDIFHRAGGGNFTLGTYSTWPLFSEGIREEGTLNPVQWPLVQGLWNAWRRLPAPPSNGAPIPGLLTSANRSIGYNTSENRVDAGEWITWNIIVPGRAEYQITIPMTGGGAYRLTLDENNFLHSGIANGSLIRLSEFSTGLHTLKLQGLQGTTIFSEGILITRPNTPAAPTLTARDGDAQVTLNWNAIEGATSYLIRYGLEPGFPSNSIEVNNVTSERVTSLANGVAYYFTVSARNANGLSAPSNEAGASPFGDNQPATLAAWDFAGGSGDATTAGATITSSRVSSSLLRRGAGFQPAGWAPNDCFLGASVAWGQNLSAAVANDHYIEFTLTPNDYRAVAIHSIEFRPSFQNLVGGPSDPRGAGLAWRVGNAPYSPALEASGQRTPSFNNAPLWEFAMPNDFIITEAIAIRIYFFGMGPYEGAAVGGPGNDITVIGSLRTAPLILWREQNGLDPAGADDAATPANDGIPNLVKYAFGFEPIGSPIIEPYGNAIPSLPTIEIDPARTTVTFQFPRRTANGPNTVRYQARVSFDLAAWTDLGTPQIIEPVSPGWQLNMYNFPVASAYRYFQVQISVIP